MAPNGGSPHGHGGSGAGKKKKDEPMYDEARHAKDLLDMIGEAVQKKVHGDALERSGSELKGLLSEATFEKKPESQQAPKDPCELNHEYHTTVTKGYNKENPCEKRSDVRFSYTEGSECDNSKIKDSNGEGGACAPFRRLHLCDQNLEHIKTSNITTHNLLADVCQAAKFEGESLTHYRAQYQQKYGDSGSPICTVLARSFADIGDIIRGKDLYRGDKKEGARRDKLENNLKQVFKKIKDDNKSKLGDLPLDKVREYWWELNRETIWKAITCDAVSGSNYFRQTCLGNSSTLNKCRCPMTNGEPNDQVPTYFDYVPQYLRWFEEWAEDFCRKKKKYVDMVKTNCGGKDGRDKYCDRDGFDCTKTIRAKGYYVRGNDCRNCTVWCGFYENWIENQKQEFEKQKNKYTNEIIGNGIQRRSSPSTEDYEGYEKQFYEKFQRYYKDGKKFLELLNEEKECKKLENDKENAVDFTKPNGNSNDNKGTFYHSKYCQQCPECGVVKEGGTFKEKEKNNGECEGENEEYNCPGNISEHIIKFLYIGKGSGDITKKLEKFCKPNGDFSQDENWKCCYANSGHSKCKMEKYGANNIDHGKIMSFNDFFDFWVGRLLTDAAGWREHLTKCLSEDKLKKCEKRCKSNCDCFKKWIEKKEKEWIEVKQQFNDQKDLPGGLSHYNLLESILEDYYFKNIQKAYGDLKSIQEMKKMIEENKKKEERSKDDVYALDVLFDHELEEAEDCLEIHEEEVDDECVEESEKIPNNPCSGTRHRAMVKNVAADMYRAARQQLTSRAGGRKALRADASKGHYNGKANESVLKDVCDITNQYSNAIGDSKDPCNGKGDRFKIGKTWEQKHSRDTTNGEFYLPPRRQHFCTSNLEHLHKDKGGRFKEVPNDKATHSLLGDVLLAANKQAEDIKKKYQENKDNSGQNGKNAKNGLTDKKTVCRAMKYSFADIGDIIKGTDLWDENDGEIRTQDALKEIFGKIKEQLNDKDKYKDDEKKTPPYKQLRADWWTANRRQVWKAMKCSLPSDIKCGATPYDDYIPQRLRWMTEWAEWFCKAQNKYYGELEKDCGGCTGKMKSGKSCTRDECTKCTEACKKYTKDIEPWKKQWVPMQIAYTLSYLQAKNGSDGKAYQGAGPDYKQVVYFFEQLRKEINSSASKRPKLSTDGTHSDPTFTSPYLTAEGYIHQELGTNVGCNIQREFCENENGVRISSGGHKEHNKNFAFRHQPYDHDTPCGCGKNTKTAQKEEKNKGACTIVEGIITKDNNNGTTAIGGCEPKTKGTYPGWDCTRNIKSEEQGACIPPRRQKLCLYYLKELSNDTKEEELRKEFIKNVAAETFFSWHYYKSKNNGVQTQLQNGTIPPQFLRSMYYTYADYRNICLGTDIFAENASRDTTNAQKQIHKVFQNSGTSNGEQKSPNAKTCQEWWNEHGHEIWEGMLCALTHAGADKKKLIEKYPSPNEKFSGDKNVPTISVEDFAKTPQFLRWFTEWGEKFCKEQTKQLETLKRACPSETCKSEETKATCINACKQYQNWLSKWEENYQKQSKKYFEDKKGKKFEKTPSKVDVNVSPHAYEYLQKALQKICPDGSCTCMDKESNETSTKPLANGDSHDYRMPASLDDVPDGYKDKCECSKKPASSPEFSLRSEDTEGSQVPPPPPLGPIPPVLPVPPQVDNVNVCDIVKKVFDDVENLKEACSLKYGKNAPTNWKCIPTSNGSSNTSEGSESVEAKRFRRDTASVKATPSSDTGSICIPPRRRRLYIGRLTQWAEKEAAKRATSLTSGNGDGGEQQQVQQQQQQQQQLQPPHPQNGDTTQAQTSSPSSGDNGLLAAFVESAAVETFFLWDRYKKIKEKEDIEKQRAKGTFTETSEMGEKLQEQLENGEIDDDFKRQMFYTLGDYRDIFFGDKEFIETLKKSGDTKIEEIKQKIDNHFSNSDNNQLISHSPSSPSKKNSGKTPQQTWWENNAKDIWEGMVCALAYKDDTSREKRTDGNNKPTLDPTVYEKFFGKDKPGTLKIPGTSGGTYRDTYDYETVTLYDDTTSPKIGSSASGENPPLTDFVKRPTYFRWLEEWGDEFCRKQKHKLYIINKDCMDRSGIEKRYSGYGEDCKDQLPEDPTAAPPLGSSCPKSCGLYKRWIEKKKDEFDKQSGAYDQQKKDATTKLGTTSDNGFYKKLQEQYTNATEFLKNLGPCSKPNIDIDDDTDSGMHNKPIFDNVRETFQHTKDCAPCSQFKIKCENGSCGGANGSECPEGNITAKSIKYENYPNGNIVMLVSDNNENGFNDNSLKVCTEAHIFKGIRKEEWTCGNVCGYNVCKPENVNGPANGAHHIITIRELLRHWLEYFLEDYSKIRKKLNSSTKNGNGCKCIKACVDKWAAEKKNEWNKISRPYSDTYNNEDGGNTLTSFLETWIPRIAVKNDKTHYKSLDEFKASVGCTCPDNIKKENGNEDVVECLLQKLQVKANKCQNPSTSGDTLAQCQTPTPVGDEPDQLEDENTTNTATPSFCKIEKPQPEKEDTCDEATPPSSGPGQGDKAKEKEDPQEDSADVSSGSPEAPSVEDQVPDAESETKPVPPTPSQPKKEDKKEEKSKPVTPPEPQLPPSTSISDILSSTIPFGIAIALTSIAFLFLKKKTKSSVDMLRVLEIPRNDYGIPTKRSSNRYIPYKSAQYKGKSYIYIEGDSGTDSGYTDHYSDITSSSESEYEELDINDIYVPGSPKYKTLIEVVLEPSKRDTTNTPNDIPSGDTPSNKITDNEWNELKQNFIFNMLQNTQNTEPNILHNNVDNNTHPTMSRHNVDQKPFNMSIHDKNLLSGEEYNYDMNNNISNNDLHSGKNYLYSDVDSTSNNRDSYSGTKDLISDNHHPYSGTDLINDSLNSGNHDIYNELLKRKENELFGAEHPKHTTTNRFAKLTNSDPIMNQLDLFHKWLDRHRDMCKKWDKNNKVDILNKLKEEWNKDNNKHNGENTINKMLNSGVSIQIHMDNNPLDDNIYLDTYPDKYTVDNKPNLVGNINPVDSNTTNPTEVQIEMSVKNTQMMKEKYPIGDVWDI